MNDQTTIKTGEEANTPAGRIIFTLISDLLKGVEADAIDPFNMTAAQAQSVGVDVDELVAGSGRLGRFILEHATAFLDLETPEKTPADTAIRILKELGIGEEQTAPLAFADVKNDTGLELKDISSELERTYYFPNDESVTLENPVALAISERGGHLIVTGEGAAHYVKPGWLTLSWLPKPGASHLTI